MFGFEKAVAPPSSVLWAVAMFIAVDGAGKKDAALSELQSLEQLVKDMKSEGKLSGQHPIEAWMFRVRSEAGRLHEEAGAFADAAKEHQMAAAQMGTKPQMADWRARAYIDAARCLHQASFYTVKNAQINWRDSTDSTSRMPGEGGSQFNTTYVLSHSNRVPSFHLSMPDDILTCSSAPHDPRTFINNEIPLMWRRWPHSVETCQQSTTRLSCNY